MVEEKRSLYDCFCVKGKGDRICCTKHDLNKITHSLAITLLIRGKPLVFKICQGCRDFDQMDGGKVLPEDRGWMHLLEAPLPSRHGNHENRKKKDIITGKWYIKEH